MRLHCCASTELKVYRFDGIERYKAKDLQKVVNTSAPKKRLRALNIPNEHCTYGIYQRTEKDYILANEECERSTLFVSKEWADRRLAMPSIPTECDALKSVLSKSLHPISCVYTFVLGTVAQCRETMDMNIIGFNDNDLVVKFGRTRDLIRRTKEHERTFINLSLFRFACIDPSYNAMAENMLREFFAERTVEYLNHREVAVLPQKSIKHLEERLALIHEHCQLKVKVLSMTIEAQKNKKMNANLYDYEEDAATAALSA